MTQRVLSTRRDLPGSGLARLESQVEVVSWTGTGTPKPAELARIAGGANGILALGNDRIDAELLDAAGPSLRVVSLASMGFDAVDQQAAADRGVVVTHTPGVLAETTADLAFALILMARRRLASARDCLHAGGWSVFRMDDYLGLDVCGATLGLLGYGQIGRAVARRAAGFGMRVLHHDPFAPQDDHLSWAVDFATLLAESDVLSLHVPLTDSTRGIIGADQLRAMKPTATLVNTSRGGVVDEVALLAALRDGVIHSAGLDVFEREPRGADVTDLVEQSRLVALPHVGSATEATRAAMVDLAVDNLLDVLFGRSARTPLPGTAAKPGAEEAVR
ncbi:2-hydroxyacid dehydrogenase [Saccharopolyspora phatthalungensis]|uniref:Lactate dehydrogenase-like 2-hydroxyacid dehydrogenase n=1 Tax=Saccharopolyspora phatthalungensis TaxID=664693 RepID=A0A840QJK1_9PSEU|nr:D-glycerate dehydrogenase [Saccharopolyspora phatthalungensis]MBB5159135.1 lactate dehydrogenase-like 2-hydroxyacid dehydrogenase [Saccharopolyspora phatthalungensis]